MTKIKYISFVFLFFSPLLNCFADDSTPINYFEYDVSDETCEIKGLSQLGKSAKISELLIPSRIEGKIVDSIAENAFRNYDFLVKIQIPETVETIGFDAFRSANVTSIILEGDLNTQYLKLPDNDSLEGLYRGSTFAEEYSFTSIPEWEKAIHRLEYGNPIVYCFCELNMFGNELLEKPAKIGKKVWIHGARKIKTNCYVCKEHKICGFYNNLRSNASYMPEPNGFQVFICDDCALNIGLIK